MITCTTQKKYISQCQILFGLSHKDLRFDFLHYKFFLIYFKFQFSDEIVVGKQAQLLAEFFSLLERTFVSRSRSFSLSLSHFLSLPVSPYFLKLCLSNTVTPKQINSVSNSPSLSLYFFFLHISFLFCLWLYFFPPSIAFSFFITFLSFFILYFSFLSFHFRLFSIFSFWDLQAWAREGGFCYPYFQRLVMLKSFLRYIFLPPFFLVISLLALFLFIISSFLFLEVLKTVRKNNIDSFSWSVNVKFTLKCLAYVWCCFLILETYYYFSVLFASSEV